MLASFDLWLLVGEWTLAMTDCAKYPNGRGISSRYTGTYPGSMAVGRPAVDPLSVRVTRRSSNRPGRRRLFHTRKRTTAGCSGRDEWTYEAGLNYG